MATQTNEVSKTFLKGLDLLQSYQNGPPSMTLAELSRRTGYDRASVRRLCFSLLHAGLMIKAGREFRLSPRVLTLAGGFLHGNGFGFDVHPLLNAQASQLESEIGLFVRSDDQALLVAHSNAEQGNCDSGLTVGSFMPLLPTAVGRMLLAELPSDTRFEEVKALPCEAYTSATKTDLTAILSEIDLAAHRKYAVVKGEFRPNIISAAVPVRIEGQTKAVISAFLNLPLNTSDADISKKIQPLRDLAGALQKVGIFAHW